MEILKTKLLRLSLIFFLVSIATITFYFSGKPIYGARYAQRIPLEIGGWEGLDIPMDEQSMRVLETRDILYRSYAKQGAPPVYLCVVFSENNRRSVHPPEVCYTASGWEIGKKNFVSSEVFSITPPFEIVQIEIAKDQNKQLISYWYKAGNHYTSSVFRHQWNMVLSQLLFRNATSALIRFSTEIGNEGKAAAQKRLDAFMAAAFPEIQKNLP